MCAIIFPDAANPRSGPKPNSNAHNRNTQTIYNTYKQATTQQNQLVSNKPHITQTHNLKPTNATNTQTH